MNVSSTVYCLKSYLKFVFKGYFFVVFEHSIVFLLFLYSFHLKHLETMCINMSWVLFLIFLQFWLEFIQFLSAPCALPTTIPKSSILKLIASFLLLSLHVFMCAQIYKYNLLTLLLLFVCIWFQGWPLCIGWPNGELIPREVKSPSCGSHWLPVIIVYGWNIPPPH